MNTDFKKEKYRLQKALNQAENYLEIAKEEINRLQAENERLREEIELLHSDYTYKLVKKKAKAEAYKECIEKVKEKSKKTEIICSGALITTNYAISAKSLNKLLKELVGENKGIDG